MYSAISSIDKGQEFDSKWFCTICHIAQAQVLAHWRKLERHAITIVNFWPGTHSHSGLREGMQEMQQSAKNKEFAFSRLGPQPAWLAGGCCVQPQTDLNSLRVQQSPQSSSLLNNLTSRPSPSQLSLSPLLLSYPSHSPDWFPTSPHPAVSLLRDSPSVFIDLAAAAAVRWQQQNWAAAVHKLLLLL